MSLDKAIAAGKEHRTAYRHSRAFDRSCRNHGSCGYCRHNRTYSNRKRLQAALQDERIWREGDGVSDELWTWHDWIYHPNDGLNVYAEWFYQEVYE